MKRQKGKRRECKRAIGPIGIGFLCLALLGWMTTASGKEHEQSQEDRTQLEQAEEQKSAQTSEQRKDEADPQAQQELERSQSRYAEDHFLSTATLIGFEVKNEEGEDVGKIYDLLVDSQNKVAPLAVVSFGGFFGIGDDLYAIPWERIEHDHEADMCVLSVPKAPEKVSDARPDWIALEESSSEENPKLGHGPYGLTVAEGGPIPVAPADTTHLVSANELIDKLVTAKGSREEFGDLHSLILGSEMGHLVCAVVTAKVEGEIVTSQSRIPGAAAGDPGLGDPSLGVQAPISYKDVAIPITLMEIDEEKKMLSANVGTQKIEAAPAFDRSLPKKEGLDRQWLEQTYRFFGEDPNLIGSEEAPQIDEAIAL